MKTQQTLKKNPLNIIVIVASLGYFVDIYDLILFGIVRVPSLKGIGISSADLLEQGIFLLNMQMLGMLAGGIIWGILGDKKGRLPVLFFTIALYSLANIANGFVTNIEQYAVLRLLAGLGLAGELGIGITLVSEVMTKETRGYGTTIVSGVGIFGAVLGYLVADMFDWRMAYWVGGGLGLLLLFMRVSVFESGMFEKAKENYKHVRRGNFFSLFTNRKRLLKYIYCILIGMPIWYIVSVLVIPSDKFAAELHITGTVDSAKAVMYHYTGLASGSFVTGIISQKLRSRKKSLLYSIGFITVLIFIYFISFGFPAAMFYLIIFLLGVGAGYWAVFVTTASENFGTNLRATVTTTVPNFVRGATVPITYSVLLFRDSVGFLNSAAIVGSVCIILAFGALYKLKETYGRELDYVEED